MDGVDSKQGGWRTVVAYFGAPVVPVVSSQRGTLARLVRLSHTGVRRFTLLPVSLVPVPVHGKPSVVFGTLGNPSTETGNRV